MKRIYKIILTSAALLFINLLFMSTVYAKDARLVDNAGLLTTEEAETLEAKLDEISETYKSDVVIVTVDSLEGRYVEAYADDYYDYHDYGYGLNASGILLLLSMEDRDWAITTTGYPIHVFTNAGQKYITDIIVPYLKKNDYNTAFNKFAELCDDFFLQALNGEPYNTGNMPRRSLTIGWILGAVAIAAVLSAIVTWLLKRKLKTVYKRANASSYQTKPLQLSRSTDQFLYHTMHKRRINSSSGGGGGRSGGSSVHTGSSGRSHGGSHGKF